ncbi:MAG TPA: translocation protein TolB [Verrucomicrobiae bacterium]|nr:translocation protein TolB [Verrucomicrobiae bacterium]
MIRKLAILASLLTVIFLGMPLRASAQDWFKTGTGLGVTKARVAVPDFPVRTPAVQPLEKTFHDVLWADLDYSGVLDLVSPSFYPTTNPSQPSELNAAQWSAAPVNAYMVAYGNLYSNATGLAVAGYLSDVSNPSAPPALQKIYQGPATDDGARQLAHQMADDIVSVLTGGLPGIAQTHIAYVSAHGGFKEIWEMDYDGANPHELTHLRSISLTPRWSPDASRIAFTCYVPFRGVVSAQICIYSLDLKRLIAFPRYPGTNSSPAYSPDGTKLAFMSGMSGDPELYTCDSTGGHLRRITFSAGVNTSPVWNPKTGNQIVFVSDRAGDPVLYMANSDGTNVQRIDLPDMGYSVDPSWSPNGQLLAFSWRRPTGNFDIYVMDIVSHQLVELTRDEGRNERPSWAPDGRHIVFESTRTGSDQIWTMLADGSLPRQLTFSGDNESPNWSPK